MINNISKLFSMYVKSLLYISVVLSWISCEKTSGQSDYINSGAYNELKLGEEDAKFRNELAILYAESAKNPETVLIRIDSLLISNKNEKDKYRSQIKGNIEERLNYLKAELYYKTGQYNYSLAILNKSTYSGCDNALAKAANYTKLKDHKMAGSLIDSINCYIEDYARGNYYETISDKNNAMKVYKDIKKHREMGHYKFYDLALKRIDELEKPNPELLKELHYPTGDPSYDIAPTPDNETRGKIFKLLSTIPECKGLERHIFRSPKTNDKDYYWIKVGKDVVVSHDYEPDYKSTYNFFIYAKDLSIKYYNPDTKELLTLEEWRKTRK